MGDYMLVPRMLISVVLMTVIQILFHLFNYATSDPQALWLMFLVPLIVTSRNGSTQDWRIVMGAVILGNFAIGYWSDGFAGQTFWDTIVRSICIGLFAGAIHIITRKARYNEELLSVGGEIARLLANQPSFEAAYQEAARQIQRLQNPSDSYVFIHLWREETQRLSLVGIAGKPSATPIQLDLRKGEGVTGRVLETGIPTIVRNRCDAEWQAIYAPIPGHEDAVSELAVPISYQGQRIGVLNVESPRKKAFDDNDKQVLEYWSEQLAISFGHFLLLNERVTSALNLAKQTIESGEAVPSQTKLSAWFGSVAQVALENLRATSMALVRLAPGTSHPVLPILVWPAVHRNIKPRITHIPENSGLWQLLNDWELRFWRADAPGASPSNMLDSARDEWVLDALRALHCQSLVFVPVGTRDNRVGALFVAYATAEPLGDLTQLSLLTFASALEKTYISLMTARTRSSYSMIGHAVHQTLVPATHNLLADADSIRRVSNDPKRVNEEITHLEQSVRDMSRFFKARTLNGRDALKNRLLEEALFIAAGELKTGLREPPQIGFDGIELLEDEAIETRRVIYRVVVEAISNSIVHGKARHIEVQADRLDFEITVEVCDDGVGMPNNPTRNQPFGIFHLRRLARQVWDARLTLERLHPHGTRVFLRLPVLPRKQNDDD